jgi:hypothetical protein
MCEVWSSASSLWSPSPSRNNAEKELFRKGGHIASYFTDESRIASVVSARVCRKRLGSLGTTATARGSGTTTASLRTATTATLEGATRSLVGTAATTSGTATATLEEGSVVLGAALLDGDGVFTDRDGAGLESGLVAINGLEVDKGAVLFASQSL